MALLLDVLEVVPGRALGGILLTHVAETARELGQPLAIGALAKPVDLEMIRLEESRTRQQSDAGLGVNQNVRSWFERRNLRRTVDQRQPKSAVMPRDRHRIESRARAVGQWRQSRIVLYLTQ